MIRGFSIAIVAFLAGCASVPKEQAGQSGAIAPAVHLTDLTPPKLELPDLQMPEVDWSLLNPDRKPSNDRDWIDEQKVLVYADISDDKVRIHNVRNAQFFTYRDCVVDYYDRTYDLSKLNKVEFIMVLFAV